MRLFSRTERGWAGHFICADKCLFRRNTLLCYGDLKITISSVGLMVNSRMENGQEIITFDTIGHERHFECMVFHAKEDCVYLDPDVSRQISTGLKWSIFGKDNEIKANEMHENTVSEITSLLLSGHKFEEE